MAPRTIRRALFVIVPLLLLFTALVLPLDSPKQTTAAGTISATNLAGFNGCNDGNSAQEWHFIINGLNNSQQAPATIHVTWANGQSADVPLTPVNNKTAHYVTTLNLDSTVTSATAVINGNWSGNFVLSHGSVPGDTDPDADEYVDADRHPDQYAHQYPN
ncbi:MAG: hypothetical protein ACJ789_15690 [Thermomicrobiales bacterium]